ncbi:hypothetical protein GCM10029964_029680 [Kibdelosporangium lantanae]
MPRWPGLARPSPPGPPGPPHPSGPVDAVTIVPPNVGELSVLWNSHYRRRLMCTSTTSPATSPAAREGPRGLTVRAEDRDDLGPVPVELHALRHSTVEWQSGSVLTVTVFFSHGVYLPRISIPS